MCPPENELGWPSAFRAILTDDADPITVTRQLRALKGVLQASFKKNAQYLKNEPPADQVFVFHDGSDPAIEDKAAKLPGIARIAWHL